MYKAQFHRELRLFVLVDKLLSVLIIKNKQAWMFLLSTISSIVLIFHNFAVRNQKNTII